MVMDDLSAVCVSNLVISPPHQVCVVCNRPFTWRKKWERCWDEVTTCSKSCNAKRRAANKSSAVGGSAEDCYSDDGIIDEKASRPAAVADTTKGAADDAFESPKGDAGPKAAAAALGAADADSGGDFEQEDASGRGSSSGDCASDGPAAELSEKDMRKAAKKAAKVMSPAYGPYE